MLPIRNATANAVMTMPEKPARSVRPRDAMIPIGPPASEPTMIRSQMESDRCDPIQISNRGGRLERDRSGNELRADIEVEADVVVCDVVCVMNGALGDRREQRKLPLPLGDDERHAIRGGR